MTLSPEIVRVILTDPSKYPTTSHYKRNKKERLISCYLFKNEEATDKYFVLNVEAPGDKRITKAIQDFSRELIYIENKLGEINPEHYATYLKLVAEKHEVSTNTLEKAVEEVYKMYFDFCMCKADREVVTTNELTEIKSIAEKLDGLGGPIFPSIFWRQLKALKPINEDLEALIGPVNESAKYGTMSGPLVFYRDVIARKQQKHEKLIINVDGINISSEGDYTFFFIKSVNHPIKNLNEIFFESGGLYLEVAILANILQSNKAFENASIKFVLIDDKNYVGKVKIRTETIKKCKERFSKDIEIINLHNKYGDYHTFGEYLNGEVLL